MNSAKKYQKSRPLLPVIKLLAELVGRTYFSKQIGDFKSGKKNHKDQSQTYKKVKQHAETSWHAGYSLSWILHILI